MTLILSVGKFTLMEEMSWMISLVDRLPLWSASALSHNDFK